MWVPLVEYGEAHSDGADYFVKKDIDAVVGPHPDVDTVVLGCTHYPILIDKIRRYVPASAKILSQGHIVADSLVDYLRRHPSMADAISRGASTTYLTTEEAGKFDAIASAFIGSPVHATTVTLA